MRALNSAIRATIGTIENSNMTEVYKTFLTNFTNENTESLCEKILASPI